MSRPTLDHQQYMPYRVDVRYVKLVDDGWWALARFAIEPDARAFMATVLASEEIGTQVRLVSHGRETEWTPARRIPTPSAPREPNDRLPRDDDGKFTAYAWPGGYPLYYITKDGGVLCGKCAREAEAEGLTSDPGDPQWYIVAAEVNWEDTSLYCDHAGERIESAYAEDDDTEEEK